MKYWFYYIVRFLLEVIFRLGFRMEVRGRSHIPRRGGFLLASNHLSYLDPPLLGAACTRRLSFMAQTKLFDHALLGAFMRGVHVIPLQRGEGDVAAIREAVRRLRRGEAIAIFPEGGRQFSGVMGTAKEGVGLLAELAHVPVIPVVVRGTFEALPPNSRRLKPAKIRVAFGPQIPYTTSPVPTLGSDDRRASRARHDQLAAQVTQQWHRLAEQLTPS
ncbi:MAG: lysophospholipid acyltransferase family protein [Candidatus Omnitrophota bacterium]|nr:lysophospholipid acyltransferase family protein [Candidatus Omnitrophota bacterium]